MLKLSDDRKNSINAEFRQLRTNSQRLNYCLRLKYYATHAEWLYADSLRIITEMDILEKRKSKQDDWRNAGLIANTAMMMLFI
jgi:hypothetical protein